MEIRVLGPIECIGHNDSAVALSGSKMRGLLAILAFDAGRVVTPQRLIEAVWGEQEVNGPNVVQVIVSKLRRALAEGGLGTPLVTRPAGYVLELDRDRVDALRFEAAIDHAHHRAGEPEVVVELIERALSSWRAEPFADGPETALIGAIRARLHELRQVALDDLFDAQLALGLHHRLVPELEARVAAEPLREHRWGQLMRALYATGRQADAMRAFQRARDTLIEEVGVEPGPELRRLEAAVLAQDESLSVAVASPKARPAITTEFRRRGNIRHPVGRCIGRENELAMLRDLVRDHRLVTLIGPGGVGKTRLALELGVALSPEVPDGVWWVELAAVRSAIDALSAIHRTLGMEGAGGDPASSLASIVAALTDRSALLIVDNCEHLLGAVIPTLEDLLAACGDLRILTTSREALDLPGERVMAVTPLSERAAVELFESRTAAVAEDHGYSVGAVEEICQRLDRLPLALELAAARARHLGLDEIRARLADRFDLLDDQSRSARAHQRNLRAVADWSYDLLDTREQIVFERLSVFADGATGAGAVVVCSTPDVDAAEVQQLIHRLVDKSLVVADRSGATTRFRMLQTLSDYAAGKLAERGTRDTALSAHASWIAEMAATVAFGSKISGAAVAAVQDEDVAIRDAVTWALVSDPPLALTICERLSAFWFGTMRVSVGWELLAAALEASTDADRHLRSGALRWALLFATMVQDTETAERHASEALAVESELGDDFRLASLYVALALAAGYRPQSSVDRWLAAARKHFTAAGSVIGLAHVHFAEGAVRIIADDTTGAIASLGDAIDVFRQHHEHLGLILAVSRLGELAWRLGDIDLFAKMHAELLDLGRSSRSVGVVTGATARLALARLEQGSLDEAAALARDALASSGESFMPVVNGYAFKTAGLVNLAFGHVEEGRTHLAAAIEAFEQGTGIVGLGQAALCWVDLSRSHRDSGDIAASRNAARQGVSLAARCGDPWIMRQTESQLASVDSDALRT